MGLTLAFGGAAFAGGRLPEDWDQVPQWAKQQVEDVFRWEIMAGYPIKGEPSFFSIWKPDGLITRAEFAAILSRALDENGQGAPAAGAKDIPAGAWYAANVNGLKSAGILRDSDFVNGYFLPSLPITRAEIAAWIGRAAEREKIPASLPERGFRDIGPSPYKFEIVAAARTGIVQGYDDGSFKPDDAVTRTEAAVMLHRLLTQMTDGAPTAEFLVQLGREADAVLTWADQKRDPKLATAAGLAPHAERYYTPMAFAGNVDGREWFLRSSYAPWYSESRHLEGQPIFLGKTVAITIEAGMHRIKRKSGAWEVDRGYAARGWYTWYRKINGRWLLASGRTYDLPETNTWDIPPFYQPKQYNQGPQPPDVGSSYWGEDGITVYDPGPNPPETARFGVTNAQGVVETWNPSIQP